MDNKTIEANLRDLANSGHTPGYIWFGTKDRDTVQQAAAMFAELTDRLEYVKRREAELNALRQEQQDAITNADTLKAAAAAAKDNYRILYKQFEELQEVNAKLAASGPGAEQLDALKHENTVLKRALADANRTHLRLKQVRADRNREWNGRLNAERERDEAVAMNKKLLADIALREVEAKRQRTVMNVSLDTDTLMDICDVLNSLQRRVTRLEGPSRCP